MTPDGHLRGGLREEYRRRMEAIAHDFYRDCGELSAGPAAMAARTSLVDDAIRASAGDGVPDGVALVGVGGYGRRELSLSSDVDLLFLADEVVDAEALREFAADVSRTLWDAGLRVSPVARRVGECGQWDADDAEGTMALLDARLVAGDADTIGKLEGELSGLLARESAAIRSRLMEVTAVRHAKFGDTVFHLEPDIKDCPGGLRDLHVLRWLARLGELGEGGELREAQSFLSGVRWFLHERHERDNNVLDWPAQEAAAERGLGVGERGRPERWMRTYFRRARSVKRRLDQAVEVKVAAGVAVGSRGLVKGVEIRDGRIELAEMTAKPDAGAVLGMFAAAAATGLRLSLGAEERVRQGLPEISAQVEDGPMLWRLLAAVLTGRHAGAALRAMHELGILELLIPEFHGIDALVVRDAYHRYTVDEHTFMVVDMLHGLPGHGGARQEGVDWPARFGEILRDAGNVELLYLAALLHDTGKARSTEAPGAESEQLAQTVAARWEMDSFESGMMISLLRNQAVMLAAMRRDVFDDETVRVLGDRISTPQELRMLTVFTYADVAAIHPGAMTAWKAEQLWLLFSETLKYMDRGVDDERIGASPDSEALPRVLALLPGLGTEVREFLEGFPRRYLLTRTPEEVRTHYLMAKRVSGSDAVELDFRYSSEVSEITLVTRDREMLFARMAGALARLGMNILSSAAFSNRQGLVVDSFRFTDEYRALEMNPAERAEFVERVREAVLQEAESGSVRRGPRRAPPVTVKTQIVFEQEASQRSTLLQIVAQDEPGLLYRLSRTIAGAGCNVEVAIVDTEGGTAIDVFYLTKQGRKLSGAEEEALHVALTANLAGVSAAG